MIKKVPDAVVAVFLAIGVSWNAAIGLASGVRADGQRIVFETDHVTYVVGSDGLNKAFIDKRSGRNHLDDTAPVPFMFVENDGKWSSSTAVEWLGGFLRVTFADTGVWAKVHARGLENYLTLEVTAVSGQGVSEIHLLRVPLDIIACASGY